VALGAFRSAHDVAGKTKLNVQFNCAQKPPETSLAGPWSDDSCTNLKCFRKPVPPPVLAGLSSGSTACDLAPLTVPKQRSPESSHPSSILAPGPPLVLSMQGKWAGGARIIMPQPTYRPTRLVYKRSTLALLGMPSAARATQLWPCSMQQNE